MHRLLKPVDYVRMPWKNGGGMTTEIVAYPSGATLADFDWRLSVADVAADGPFSRFSGVDRILTLLSGAGIVLSGGGQPTELRAPYEPCEFSGDDEIRGALVAGPVRDLNLMLRRDRVRGRIVVVRDEGARIAPARWRACHTADGAVECLVPGHPPVVVAREHTALFEDAGATLAVNPVSRGAVALVACVDALP
jgi:environmental stress-induced protein Ves